MVGVLLAFGAQADLAPASVLAYRGLAIWLPAPIGLAALGALQRTIVRWTREDAPSRGDARRRNSPHSLDSVPVPAWPVSEPALHGAA